MAVVRISPRVMLAVLVLAGLVAGVALLQVVAALPGVSVPQPVKAEARASVSVSRTVPHWLGGQVTIREGLQINGHAQKHAEQSIDAWMLYDLLLSQQCAASRNWCKGNKELYLCQDPVSGLIGGLLVEGDEIITGYAGSEGYWHGKVREWEACDGRWYE